MLRRCMPPWTMRLYLPRGRHHAFTLERIIAGRLLDIDILAGLTGPDGGQRVPVIGGGDDHASTLYPRTAFSDRYTPSASCFAPNSRSGRRVRFGPYPLANRGQIGILAADELGDMREPRPPTPRQLQRSPCRGGPRFERQSGGQCRSFQKFTSVHISSPGSSPDYGNAKSLAARSVTNP